MEEKNNNIQKKTKPKKLENLKKLNDYKAKAPEQKQEPIPTPAPIPTPTHSHEHEHEHKQTESQATETEKAEKNKEIPAKTEKKDEAVAKSFSLPLSKKHAMYICNFIKNKKIDSAISELEQVLKFKRAIPFKGEIPHRKGMMSGRYPIKASKTFITILKSLKGNAIVNGLDLDKTRISFGMANWASRPAKSGGRRFKRTHVVLKAMEIATEAKK